MDSVIPAFLSRAEGARPTRPATPWPLLVVSKSLEGGGAELVMTILLRYFDRARFRPSLALFARRGVFLDEIPPDVPVYDLAERNPFNVLRTAVALRRVIDASRPAVILSVLKHANLMTLAVCRGFRRDTPVVASERITLSVSLQTESIRRLKRALHRRLYPQARRIIAVSHGVRADLEQRFGIAAGQIRVIYNPSDARQVQSLATEAPDLPLDWDVPTVVAAGRLTKQKDFPTLLQAFAIATHGRACRLLILGEGEDRAALTRQVAELGLTGRVLMPGFRRNPFAYMGRGQVFVLSSLWEGFSNVIVEAMACGTPVVATDCPSGPGEIITHGVNGLLVPPRDPAALAQAIGCLLADGELRGRLAAAGRVRAADFSPEPIVRAYEAVLAEALDPSPAGVHP